MLTVGLRAEVFVDELIEFLVEFCVDAGTFSFLFLEQGLNVEAADFARHEVHAVEFAHEGVFNLARLQVHLVAQLHRHGLFGQRSYLQDKRFVVGFVGDSCISLLLYLIEDAGHIVRLAAHLLGQLDRGDAVHALKRLGSQCVD